MSIKVQSYVWENSKAKGSQLLLLLAIADHAHDDGEGAFPSVETLAKKCRQTERNTQFLLRELESSGEILTRKNAGPHGCNIYVIPVPWNADTWGEKFSPLKTSVGGVKTSVENIRQISPEPSLESSIKPKEKEKELPETENGVNFYAEYSVAFGDMAQERSTQALLQVETVEEFPREWVRESFARTVKRERASGEVWKQRQRVPYALQILNEWKRAGKILPESPPTYPKPREQFNRPAVSRRILAD